MSSDESTHQLFEKKMLLIPDYVIPTDAAEIYHYFDHYNIAQVENVTFHTHADDTLNTINPYTYGYAIIEIKEWYNNFSARYFYEAIEENKGRIVYDDPHYWDVEFYDGERETENNNTPVQNIYKPSSHVNNINLNITPITVEGQIVDSFNDDDVVVKIEETEDTENIDVDVNADVNADDDADANFDAEYDSYEDFDSGSDNDYDDEKDENYEYSEPDETLDRKYENFKAFRLNRYKYNTRSKTNQKSIGKYKKTKQDSKSNVDIVNLLIKKKTEFKKKIDIRNVWNRRLRQKIS